MNIVKEIFIKTLKHNGDWSEKRITKFTIITSMLLLTFTDAFYNKRFQDSTLLIWLSAAGYDGYRMTKEKKMVIDSKDCVTPPDGTTPKVEVDQEP